QRGAALRRTGGRYPRAAPRRCSVYDGAESLAMRWDEGMRSTPIPRAEQTMPAQTPQPPAPLGALVSRAEELPALLDAPPSAAGGPTAGDVPRPERPRPQLHRPTWLS